VALVIGNNAYAAAPLKNPVNDSHAIAAELKQLGFQVVERENLKVREIPAMLREFRSKLQPGGTALVFYAGHGLQIKGVNYLPAVDADISSEEDVPLSSIDVNQLLDLLGESKTRLNLVFLDACRNNPFTRSLRSGASGLAKVEAPSGTLISFATRPGSTAADGEGSHGLYTEYLLQQILVPNQPIEQALKQVTRNVRQASKGRQEPWMEGAIEGDFYFRGGPSAAAALAPADPLALELAFWNTIRDSKTAQDYRAYLEQYPKGQFTALARQRIKQYAEQPLAAKEAERTEVAVTKPLVPERGKRKLVAIAGFENRSTYGADKLWDTSGQLLTSNLLEMGVFRLVEWERMKQLFDWHELSTNGLVKSPESREKARKILLTEYFLTGAVTHFDVSQHAEVSAFSKRKVYITDVRVDLQLQDCATGEYLSGATGESTVKQEFSGDFSGGQTGSWNPKSADTALNNAIREALDKLVKNYRLNVEVEQ
jgi:curli biogenesis system outer membrane secretion channel CsgG